VNPCMVFVLPSGLRFVALVDREDPAGFAVAAPLVLTEVEGPEGQPQVDLQPLLPMAELDVAFMRREQILCTYQPEPGLAQLHFDAAVQLSPVVARRLSGQAAPAAPTTRTPTASPVAPPPVPIAAVGGQGLMFQESALAHQFLDDLEGIEIGGSAHNPFGLRTRNVDYTDDLTTIFKQDEKKLCGKILPVDIVAPGDRLPVPDASTDFVVSSHVLEHFFDPIAALQEWYRVVRPGGFIFAVVPHKERTFDKDRPRTTLQELLERHAGTRGLEGADLHAHHNVWITEDVVELVNHLGWKLVAVQDVDDKVGNGFTVAIQKA